MQRNSHFLTKQKKINNNNNNKSFKIHDNSWVVSYSHLLEMNEIKCF